MAESNKLMASIPFPMVNYNEQHKISNQQSSIFFFFFVFNQYFPHILLSCFCLLHFKNKKKKKNNLVIFRFSDRFICFTENRHTNCRIVYEWELVEKRKQYMMRQACYDCMFVFAIVSIVRQAFGVSFTLISHRVAFTF